MRATEESPSWESVNLRYRHDQGAHEFSLHERSQPHPRLATDDRRIVERDDLVITVVEPTEEDAPMPVQVLVEREGTHVAVSSQQLHLDELIEIAASLVPAPDSPPPAVER